MPNMASKSTKLLKMKFVLHTFILGPFAQRFVVQCSTPPIVAGRIAVDFYIINIKHNTF
jgi:hypothetical protein